MIEAGIEDAIELDDLDFLFKKYLPTLDFDFIRMMNDIGAYGSEKYGENSFEAKRKRGDLKRDFERVTTSAIIEHARLHGDAYQDGEPHDHFGTVEHQLAAMAFNGMMELIFRKAEGK